MSKKLPLDGVRAVEFVHMVMGPTCGLVLADLGAEVIKVEPLEGDHTRKLTASGAGFFPTYNRNKKSLAVDLKSPAGREIVLKLVKSADVVSENFRPGAMDKLGFGYDAVKTIKPDIIYCSHKGFLPGPYEHRTALDEVVQMMGGLAYMTGGKGKPIRAGASVNDIMGGMFGAIAILAALYQRRETGAGQYVQSGLFENNVFLVAQHMIEGFMTGTPVVPMPDRIRAWAVYDTFKTSDGEQVFVGVVTDTQWKVFCEAFGLADLLSDPSLKTNPQRVEARPRVIPIVTGIFAQLTKPQVMAKCEELGLPFAPIAKPEDLFDDPHLKASNGMTGITLMNGVKTQVPVLPIEIDGNRLGTRLDLPHIGQHTRELLAQLGYAPQQIEILVNEGVARAA
ncbi:MAG TPA: CaiB/BaiF CoA-transferase family protein [Burkholderiales bacterium]|jgi:crotonobetainyl-CoA:carnitine CoA-transferase CaiB-like acyl-CoA transferase|nr:CaiB/BaiF CoA-transferase family protein [Burkholderiales bacterium]